MWNEFAVALYTIALTITLLVLTVAPALDNCDATVSETAIDTAVYHYKISCSVSSLPDGDGSEYTMALDNHSTVKLAG